MTTRSHAPVRFVLTALLLVACGRETPVPAGEVPAAPGYAPVAAALEPFIASEVEAKGIPALSVALVDGDRVVWARGFGEEAPGIPATPETVYRVGSVSKLFTDLAVMQLVEAGELELDLPVAAYLPDFDPGPGVEGITLRHLMSHRSGLVREPPVGHYFDDTSPSLAATVGSLNGTGLVYPPGARTKYSNAAIAVVGFVLERTRGRPFAEYVGDAVLEPLGMVGSAFNPEPRVLARLARAEMWGLDRAPFPAPTFELGMTPAGSMYSTVLDLSRFLSALFRGGEGVKGRLVSPATLERMWTPQFAPEGATTGYGLGFAVGELDGRRRLGHGGAIYGFSTELAFLPDERLGVVVASALDGTNAVTERIADEALAMMLAVRAGGVPEPPVETEPVTPGRGVSLEGLYGPGGALELDWRDGRLVATPWTGGSPVELRALGDTLVVDGRLGFGGRFAPDPDGLRRAGGQLLPRAPDPFGPSASAPPPAPEGLEDLVGEYGWDHNVLYVLERGGRLYTLIEWFYLYPLDRVSPDSWAFPTDGGLYHGEGLVFRRDGTGRVTGVEAAGILFPRREVGTERGETFRIVPGRPVEELRSEALAASPPEEAGTFREPELVELVTLEPGIRLDIRYATTNNFMSSVFYDEARAFLQRPAAEAVARAHRSLAEWGYGLLVHDGYRPWYVTKMFWDATPESQRFFVANPANGSRHNRGAAVDLSLYDLRTGAPVEMVSGYDEFSPRAYPDYPGGTGRGRWLRELLRRAMEAEGFQVYEGEWWHFDHETWREYGIQNVVFDQITVENPVAGGA